MYNIKVYHINCKVYLQKDIKLSKILYEISNFIDLGFGEDVDMLKFHKSRGLKKYVHSGFVELEEGKVYREGKVYSFAIRCIDKNLKDYFVKVLKDISSSTMKGLATTIKIIPKMHIEKLYSVTPLIIKTKKGYWRGEMDFFLYEKRLIDNAMKKAKAVLGRDFNEDFTLYNRIEILNKKPIATKYKDISFLGDKLELYIADNEKAQIVAYILLGTGLLENNSSGGYGFMNYKAII